MGTAIQKITLSLSVLMTCAISPLASANKLLKCSTGELLVGQKQVGTANYYAENCAQFWQGQSIFVYLSSFTKRCIFILNYQNTFF